jgi:hypothetical protein
MRMSKISNSGGVGSRSNVRNGRSLPKRYGIEALGTCSIAVCVVLLGFLYASISSHDGLTLLAMHSFSKAFGQ